MIGRVLGRLVVGAAWALGGAVVGFALLCVLGIGGAVAAVVASVAALALLGGALLGWDLLMHGARRMLAEPPRLRVVRGRKAGRS